MKNGKVKQNNIDNDFDLNSDLDMGDFDFDMEPPKDDRKPIIKLGSAFIEGATTGVRDTSFLKKTLKDVLPKGFGDTLDMSDKVGQNIRGIYDDSVKEIKPAIKDFKRVAAKLVPKESSFVPKKVADMIKRWEEEAKSDSRGGVASKDAQREDFLNIQLTEAFKEQFTQAAKDRGEDAATTKLQQGLELTRHRDLFGAVNQSNLFLSRIDNYQTNITLKYQKKSLEVQYRQLFATQDILEETRKSFALQDITFNKLVKNTALPDFVKINSTEFREQVFKNKFYESVQRGLFGGKDDFVEKIFSNIRKQAKDKVAGFANDFRTGLMGAEMAGDSADSMKDMGGPGGLEMAGGAGGSLASQTLVGWLAKKYVKPVLDKHEGVQKTFRKAGDLVNNSSRHLTDFRNSNKYDETFDPEEKTGTKVKNWFMRFVQSVLPNQGPNTTMDKVGSKDMESPYVITRRTDKSLNEIIPGYLARILREVQVIRTGNNDVELTKFDFDTSNFISASQSLLNAKNKLIPTKAFKHTVQSVDEILSKLDPTGTKIPDALKTQIKDTLLSNDPNNSNMSVGALIDKMDPKKLIKPDIRKTLLKILLSKSSNANSVNKSLDELLEMLEAKDLSPAAQKELKKKLLDNSVSNRGANAENLAKRTGYSNENRDELTTHMSKFFSDSGEDRLTNFKNKHNSLKDNFPDPRAYIQEMINLGRGDELDELGLLKEDGVSFDIDGYLKHFRGESDLGENRPSTETSLPSKKRKPLRGKKLRTSDINAKKDFKKITGKSALESIKKTLISAWNYKKGKGDSGSHVGPMAQTVNKTMGEDAAPGGTKVDLVTMNGMTMSAIQELDKRQREQSEEIPGVAKGHHKLGKGKPKENLSLDNHLLSIRCLLEEIRDTNKATISIALGSIPDFTSNIDFSKFNIKGFDSEKFKEWFEKNRDKALKTGEKAKQTFDDTIPGMLSRWMYNASEGTGKAYNYAKDKTTTGAKAASEQLSKVASATKDKAIKTFTKTQAWYENEIYDIWREGENKPRILAIKIQNGQYLNLKTNKILTHQKEINGPIVDKDNLAKILISEEDLPFLYTRNPKSLAKRALKSTQDFATNAINKTKDAISQYTPSIVKFAKELITGVVDTTKLAANKVISLVDSPIDIYVKGDKLPTLLAIVMNGGGYFSCMTNKVIVRPGQIDGPVKGADGIVILTVDHIRKGLVDHLGNPIKTPLDKLKNALSDSIDGGIRLGNLAWEGAKTFGNKAVKALGSLFSEFSIEINGKKSLTVLEQIRDLLYDKYHKAIPKTPGKEEVKTNSEILPTTGNRKVSNLHRKAKARAMNSLKAIKDKFDDIYVQGEKSPRITEVKLKLGHYVDCVTNATILDVKDIVNDVKDETGKVVLTLQELTKLAYFDVKANVYKKLDLAKNSEIVNNLKLAAEKAKNALPPEMSAKIGSVIDKAKEMITGVSDKVLDVYTEGSKDPVLYAKDMIAGLYRDKETNDVITHQSEIKGEVVDENNNTVIKREDLPNLATFSIESNRFKPLKLIGKGLLSIIRPLWYFQTKVAPKMVAWNFKMIGKGLKLGGKIISSVLGLGKGKCRDVYVGDEGEPRLYATKLELGHYRLKGSNKVIFHHTDITGEVIDENDQVKLFDEDLDNLKVYNSILRIFNPFKLVGWVGKKIGQGTVWFQKKMMALSKSIFKGIGWVGKKVIKGIVDWFSKPGDVYVVTRPKTAALRGELMKVGEYISSVTKKIISKISDIDGEVKYVKTGEVALSDEDIKAGLINSEGKPIKLTLAKFIGSMLGKLNRAFSMKVALKGKRTNVPEGIKPINVKGKILNTPEEKTATHTEKTVSLLKDMLTVLKKKFDPKKILGDKDGDGIRENSYEDIMRKKGFLTASKDKTKEAVAEKLGANKEKPGVLGNLFNKFFGKKEQVAEDSRDYLKDIRDTLLAQSAGNALGLGSKGGKGAPGAAGKVSKLAKYAKWGGRALGVGGAALGAYGAYQSIKEGDYTGAAKDAAIGVGTTLAGSAIVGGATGAMAGTGVLAGAGAGVAGTVGAVGSAGSALATLGTGIVAAVGWPVILAAGAVALTGMAVYGGYKYFKNRSLSPLVKIRYVQYGFNKEQKEHASKILQLEKYLMDFVVIDNGSASIKEDKFDFQKLVEPFDLDHKNPKDLEIFFEWYRKRFKSIYLTHCTALFAINKSKDLTTAEDLKDPEKKSYIDAIKFPNGPYDVTRLPIKDLGADYRCSNAKDVAAVIAEAISELKLDKIKDKKKTDVVGTATKAAIAANTTGPTESAGDVESGRDFSDTDSKTKLPEVGITSLSTVNKGMLVGNDKATALSAVKYKAYGLVELDASKVRAIRQLESEILYTVKYDGNKLATWNGNAIDVLNKLAGVFGIGDVLGKDAGEWTYWFKNRFLPVYLGYLTGYLVLTGKVSVGLDTDLIKPINQVDLAKILAGLSGIWSETKTPWPNYKLNTDSNSTKDNIEFLVSVAKDVKIEEDKKTHTPYKESAKADTPKLDTPKEAGNIAVNRAADVKTVAAPASTGSEGESKPTGGAPSAPAKPSKSQPTPPIAGGNRSDGAGALTAIKFKGNASLNGANASMIKLFYGMVQEYNEKTGKTVGVNSGFRTYAQQEAEYKANPAKAAKPGTSLHEKGLAIDVNSVTVDEMESLGLMKKYGFTRPVGGESWHIEPAGIQTDIKRFFSNANQASDAIKEGVGRGGGGYGTVSGAKKYGRDPALAKSLLGAPVDNFMKEELKKDIDSRANKTPIKTDKAKTGGSGIGGSTGVTDKSSDQSGAGGSPDASGTSGAGAEGESKPTGAPPSGKSDLTKKEPLPSDPTVKIPDPTGTGYKGFKDLIIAAAKMVGLDPAIALSTAAIESDFNPKASAGTTGASGLFQFLKSTWDETLGKFGKKYGLEPNASVMDPKANSIMGAQYIKTNIGIISKKVKRNIGPTETYLSHFLGPGGAIQFLTALEKDPNTDAAKLMPGPAKSNHDIFYNGNKSRTVSEVYTLLDNRIKTKAKSYGIDMSSTAIVTGKDAGAKDTAGAATGAAGATGGGGGRGSVNPESVKDTSGGTPSASGGGRGSVNPESVRDSSGGAAGRGSVNPNSVVDTTSEIVRNDAVSSAPKVPNEVTDKSITAKPSALESVVKPSVSESISNIGKSPMSDTYGFNTSLITKKEDVNKNAISKELFQTTEGLLGQSLEVEKQILATLKSMFGVMNNNANKDTSSDKTTENAPKAPQSTPYTPPRVPVPMRKTIV